MILKVDFWGEEFILYLSVSNGADRKRRSKVMKNLSATATARRFFRKVIGSW
jgi:hypothetical protein